MTKDDARELLHENGLRATAPRLAVLHVLAESQTPLSNTEMFGRLGTTEWDPATIYRNLVKLSDAGVASVASRIEGIDRYSLVERDDHCHLHPHFVCEECNRALCLPAELLVSIPVDGIWAESIREATVQFRGACPDCA